jgi:hypothetical protein
MKKSAVRSSLVVVAIAGIFLSVIALVLLYSMPGPSMPSFNFLGDRKPAYQCKKSHLGNNITEDIYSFEADFNDVFPDANKELLALGYKDKTSPALALWNRDYLLLKGPHKKISVRIHKRQKLGVYSTPESSDYSSPERYEFHIRDGWVSIEVRVEVVKWRIRLYAWLYGIFHRLRP